jgi:hypothetical protein
MNENVVYASKAAGLLLAYGMWAFLVWHGNTPADGFVNGLLALIGFLTGNAVGKQSVQKEAKNGTVTDSASAQSGASPGAGSTGS